MKHISNFGVKIVQLNDDPSWKGTFLEDQCSGMDLYATFFPLVLMARIHSAILRTKLHAMDKLHPVSTPEIVACNIAALEFHLGTSATLRATNFFMYPPSATFCAKSVTQISANQISHTNLTCDPNVAHSIQVRFTAHQKKKAMAWSAAEETVLIYYYRGNRVK